MCASYASYGSGSGAHLSSAGSARHHLLRVRRSQSFTTASRSHSRPHHQLTPSGSAGSSSSQGAHCERGVGAGAGGGGPSSSSRIATCFPRGDTFFRPGVGGARGPNAGEGHGSDSSAQDAGARATKGKWETTSAGPRQVMMPFSYWPSQMAPGDEAFFDDEDARSSDSDPVSRCLVRSFINNTRTLYITV